MNPNSVVASHTDVKQLIAMLGVELKGSLQPGEIPSLAKSVCIFTPRPQRIVEFCDTSHLERLADSAAFSVGFVDDQACVDVAASPMSEQAAPVSEGR
jgi:hypothetical protein